MAKLLEVKNLTVKYGDKAILDNLSFSISEGNIVGIIGPNGSGKTTLVKALLGLISYEGDINWQKEPNFGYVPQKVEFDRDFPLTVKELFLLRFHHYNFWTRRKRAEKKILFLLKRVGAEKLLESRIGNLSGGELQRVLVAYALVGRPEMLFFDEPSSGIDIGGEETIYNLIETIVSEDKITAAFVSHDLDVVFSHADQVICVNKKLVCQGAPRKVLTGQKIEELYGKNTGIYHHHEHHDI